jgi:hypothetical protein
MVGAHRRALELLHGGASAYEAALVCEAHVQAHHALAPAQTDLECGRALCARRGDVERQATHRKQHGMCVKPAPLSCLSDSAAGKYSRILTTPYGAETTAPYWWVLLSPIVLAHHPPADLRHARGW